MDDRKRAFALAVIAGQSPTQAAIAVGYPVDMAEAMGRKLREEDNEVQRLIDKMYGTPSLSNMPPLPNVAQGNAMSMLSEMGADMEPIGPCDGDPMVLLERIIDNPLIDTKTRMEAAKALLPFKHQKLGEQGKKSAKQDAAAQAAGGRFATRPAPGSPQLKAVQGGKQD